MTPAPSQANSELQYNLTVLLGLAAYLLAPLFAWIYLGLLFAARGQSKLSTLWTFVGFVPFAFTINNSKQYDDAGLHDWKWYSDHFFQYPTLSFDQIWGNSLVPGNDPLEPFYFSASWLIANIWPSNLSALVAFIVIVVYGTITLSIPFYRQSFGLDPLETLGLQYVLYGFGVTFTLVTHLVRQEIAIGFLVLAMSLLLNRHWARGIVVVILAISSHNAAGFIALLMVCSVLLSELSLKKLIPIAGVLGSSLGIIYWWAHGRGYAGLSDGGVSTFVIGMDILVIVSLLVTTLQLSDSTEVQSLKALLGILLMCSAFIMSILFEPLPALRFYFFMTPLVGIGVLVILKRLVKGAKDWYRVVVIGGLGVSVPVLGQLRILRSGFIFETEFIDLLFTSTLF